MIFAPSCGGKAFWGGLLSQVSLADIVNRRPGRSARALRCALVSQTILARIKSILQDAFKERLAGVVLYGSQARGEATPDSDIDLLVLLNGPADSDTRLCVDALYPLTMELERPIHAKPTDIQVYQAQEWRLYRFAKREGIVL